MTAPQFRDEVARVAKGLIAAGVAARRPGRPDEPHPLRVDADRLRDLVRRRGHGADLRDLRRRAGRSGSWPTPARSPCVVETAAHAAMVEPRPRPRRRRCSHVWQIEAGAVDELTALGAGDRRRRGRRAPDRGRRPDDRRHDHLHLRHHRPPQGLHAHPPQLRTPTSANAVPVLDDLFDAAAPARCCSCRWRTSSPGSSRSAWCRPGSDRPQRRHQEPGRRPRRVQADLHARRTPGLREGLQHRQAEAARRRQGHDLRPRRAGTAIAYREALDTPGGPGLRAQGPARAVRPAGLLQAARRARRPRATTPISGGAPLGDRLGHFFRGIGVTDPTRATA